MYPSFLFYSCLWCCDSPPLVGLVKLRLDLMNTYLILPEPRPLKTSSSTFFCTLNNPRSTLHSLTLSHIIIILTAKIAGLMKPVLIGTWNLIGKRPLSVYKTLSLHLGQYVYYISTSIVLLTFGENL